MNRLQNAQKNMEWEIRSQGWHMPALSRLGRSREIQFRAKMVFCNLFIYNMYTFEIFFQVAVVCWTWRNVEIHGRLKNKAMTPISCTQLNF